MQKKLIPLFHYALNLGGFLFLGTSETLGDCQICLPCRTASKLNPRVKRPHYGEGHSAGTKKKTQLQ